MNILGEDSQGKFFVELFNADMSTSVNLEVIQHGLAKPTRNFPFNLNINYSSPPKGPQGKVSETIVLDIINIF